MLDPSFDQLQIFHGEMNPAWARIYARLPRPAEGANWRLTGSIRGPYNAFAATLPMQVALRDRGPGPTLLAEAVLPDPCVWSPDAPAWYDVEVTLTDERGTVRATAQQPLGIRALGIRGAAFYGEGKRWVLRAVERRGELAAAEAASVVTECREAWAALLASAPDEAVCREASRQGVVLAAWVTGEAADAVAELHRLARWPAVAMAIVEASADFDSSLAAAAPNILLGQFVRGQVPLAPWAKIAFAEVDAPASWGERFARTSHPVVAMRKLDAPASVSVARAACDDLQRDLAPYGDFAGYAILESD